jgi:NAD(P)-dependent dehydrogenase (short-subunit alcohol dehydrogenase family)
MFTMVADVGVWEEARRFILRTADQFGTIDVLVNNASVLGPRLPIADYPLDDFWEVMRVNLLGSYFLTKLAIPIMSEHSSGSIINVSSGVGTIGKAQWGAYSISKFGVEALTQIVADELRGTGVRVNTVNPGRMATTMRRTAYPEEDPSTLPDPKDLVDVFVYLASDLSTGVTGQRFDAAEFTMPTTDVDTDEELPGVI